MSTLDNISAIENKFFIRVDDIPRKRGTSKRIWMKVVRIDMEKSNLYKDLTVD